MLMLDCYLVAGGRALDLATGNRIRWHLARHATRSVPTLFKVRGRSWLIDFDLRGRSRVEIWEPVEDPPFPVPDAHGTLDHFRAALADARDGRPRALDLAEPSTAGWGRTVRVLAREARLSGFVPFAADALGAVLAQARWRWPSWLKDRSLVIFATDGPLAPDATLALFRLATRDTRPHLIVRTATTETTWRWHMVRTAMQVHESPPESALSAPERPQSAEDLVARSHRLRADGRLCEAEALARWSILLSMPGGATQDDGRCALARCLFDQRRILEARAAILHLDHAEADELRAEMSRTTHEPLAEPALVEAFVGVLRICQDVEEPELALLRVAGALRERLSASTVAFTTIDGGTARVMTHAGAPLSSAEGLALARRVLDTGVPVPACEGALTVDSAVPVRYGSSVVGAIWCRWSAGVPVLPADVAALLGLAATAVAPAVYATCERTRAPQSVASLVPDLVGDSAPMQTVRLAVVRAAASPFPVLVEGESGCGKELVARAIHASSARRTRRFCALNCAALNDDLVEAELFGHTRGAFTGAVAERVGLFEDAQGGTLFLDEVAELGPRIQAKLLRVLQEGEVRRVGESSVRRVDVRIVAATNRPLAAEAETGRFRADLRYRLDVLRIAIPPLRERLEDVPALVRHAWSSLAQRTGSRAVLSPSAMSVLGAYDWPGNVRELQNVLASVMVAGPMRGVIGPQALPSHIARAAAFGAVTTLAEARRAFEARYVRAALARADGRTLVAARELGLSRQGLTKLLTRLDLEVRGAAGVASALE